MPEVLVIEDESIIREAIQRHLNKHGMRVDGAESLEQALQDNPLERYDLILADMRLPGRNGLEVIQEAGNVPVVIMTSYASIRSAVEAMREGAVDYIAKPFDNDDLRLTVERALRENNLKRQNRALRAQLNADYPVNGIIGDSPPMQKVFERINRVAPTDTTVLILGESGTGKELVARALHEQSNRREAPLIAVNCAAIPESLIEAELFGHEKGAFTGAESAREGLVEAAHGGTLFLDEIAELPMAAQARLLRVLQESEIRRVGASHSRQVDIRLVAATHRDLAALVESGAFREDLYFRINVMEIQLPALRERIEDIPSLAEFLLKKACQQLNRSHLQFDAKALEEMARYNWPGNVRELENVIERAVILTDTDIVTSEQLGLSNTRPASINMHLALSLEEYFCEFVRVNEATMTETELAQKLGISRKALWERRQRLGLQRQRPTG